ncbi:hypothetical protein Tco_1215294 [Tanacetum coccineum]
MVACLERIEGNADFHQIVDFLNASYIEQFWSTTKTKIVDNGTQIHAKVYGKTIVISASSVRSNLHFNDEDGVTSLTNSEILENLALMGYEIWPPKKVGDEAVYTREDDRVVRATITATSLEVVDPEVNTSRSEEDSMEDQDDLTDFVPPTPHDSPLSGGHTPGCDKGRPNINELMAICTKLSNRVLALETSKTAQDLVIKKLKKKVKRLEKKLRARTPWMKVFKIGTSRRKSLDKENVSKQGRNLKTRPMFEEGDFDDDFDDIDDMVNEAMENVEGDTVNAGGAVNIATYPRFIQILLNKHQGLILPHKRTYGEGSTVLVESHHTPITTPSTSQPPLSSPSRVPTPPYDLPLLGGHTPGSDEGRMQQTELMDLVIKLSDKVLALETDFQQTKQVYSTAVTKLILRLKRLEKIVKSSKARRRAKIIVSDDEKVSKDSSK